MKNAVLILVFSFAGLVGYAQQSNVLNDDLVYDLKTETKNFNSDQELVLEINTQNEFNISFLEGLTTFSVNNHEFVHENTIISEAFEFIEGAFSLNEYAVNYEATTENNI
ncbi:hypothetical protein [Namhaeicola litoreus]|uniref:Uncharacterized protein n=1 Tax=Namhaeicola litoreus TaxID=1052145 RepID=A0ABW3Y6F7_9FLAO